MPIDIIDEKDCTGCGACANICPKLCIELKANACGFYYPIVDSKLCINCDRCVSVCSNVNKTKSKNEILSIYAGWSKNKEIRENSTSGGFFSELAYYILNKGGCVAGAEYSEDNSIQHTLIYSEEDIIKVRQSKYAQSQPNNIYSKVKEELYTHDVLFCGTPCQVSALISFLGKEPDNLFTVDFICRGVNSPKAYREWLNELERNEKSKVTRVWFKYKANGWKKSPKCTRVDFENGNVIVLEGEKNSFMTGYLGPNLYIRPCCGDCNYKGANRFSDITVGDFWGIEKEYDDDRGTSLILINSKKGQELFNSIQDSLFFVERSLDEIITGNICFTDSVTINPRSDDFLKNLGTIPFSKLVRQYTRKNLVNQIKSFFHRI